MLELGKLERFDESWTRERGERALDLCVTNDCAGDECRPLTQLRLVHVDPLEKIKAAFAAEPDVDEHGIDLMRFEDRQRGVARTGRIDGVAAAGEPRRERTPDRILVIDVKHGGQLRDPTGWSEH